MQSSARLTTITCDLDNTLLGPDHTISDANLRALEQARTQAGVRIILASGRMMPCMTPYASQLSSFTTHVSMVCYNGALAVGPAEDKHPILYSKCVPKPVLNTILAFGEREQLAINVYPSDHGIYVRTQSPTHRALAARYAALTSCDYTYVESYDAFQDREDVFKVLLLDDDPAALYSRLTAAQPELLQAAHLIRGEFFVEVLAVGVNKATALAALCEVDESLSLERMVCFGDGENDKEMLRAAGCGVAVANAADVTKKAADVVSEFTNAQDAVAKEVLQLLESGAFKA